MAEQGLAPGCAVNVVGLSIHAGVMSNAQDRGNSKSCAVLYSEKDPALMCQKKVATMTTYGKKFVTRSKYTAVTAPSVIGAAI